MNYDEMLLSLTKKVNSIKIPSIMTASDSTLDLARKQKTEVAQEISRIRKLMKEKGLI
jgi:hypothetical protein